MSRSPSRSPGVMSSSASCPRLPLPKYATKKLEQPLETYPRPGQYFADEPEGYFPLPDEISRMIGKKRRRSAKGGGMDHLSNIMDEFVIPNKDKDWISLQEIKELENQERDDKAWNSEYKYVPCFERNTDTEAAAGKKLKLFKKGKNCGEQIADNKGRKFTWTKVHLLVARKPDEGYEQRDEQHDKFFEAAYQVCKSSFFYHCARPGTSQGIGGGYFKEAWGHATSIGLLISDCGKQTGSTEDCSFIVLGFCLLRDYSGVVEEKFQRQKAFLADATPITPAPASFPDYAMYIDVVCSKISTAQNLMKLFTQPTSKADQKWKSVMFSDKEAMGKPHYVLLRAIPSVYTYYPIMYKFIRSMDNEKMHPIFKVRQDAIVHMLLSHENPELRALSQKQFHEIATQMFGIEGWRAIDGAPRSPAKLYVYKLSKEFVTFVKQYNLASAALHVFVPTKYVCGDSDTNGYLYGLHVNA